MKRRIRYFGIIFLLCCTALFSAACDRAKPQQRLAANATVLALGDSLTYGYGATADTAYPQRLARATGWRVINAGINGNTSAQALARLPDLLEQYDPELVIISIGGNDFLQRLPYTQPEANILAMIDLICAQSDADILLVGIPHYSLAAAFGHPADHPLYRRIADSKQVALLGGAWGEIIADKTLRADQVHPNAAGYARFTDTLTAYLRDQGWLP